MTILEILEAHTFGHSLLTVRGFCDGCDWHSYTGPKVAIEDHRAHVAEVLEQNMQSVVSETQEQAWDEGYGDCWEFHRSAGMIGRETNPYRKESIDGR